MFVKFLLLQYFVASIVSFFASAETMMLDDFSKNPESRWQYVSDQVMAAFLRAWLPTITKQIHIMTMPFRMVKLALRIMVGLYKFVFLQG